LKIGEEINLNKSFLNDIEKIKDRYDLLDFYFYDILTNIFFGFRPINLKIGRENIFFKKVSDRQFVVVIHETDYENSFLKFIDIVGINFLFRNKSFKKRYFDKILYKIIKKNEDKESFLLLLKKEVIPYNIIQRIDFFKFLYKNMNDEFFDEYFKKYIVKLSSVLKDKKIRESIFNFLKHNYSDFYKVPYQLLAFVLKNKKAMNMHPELVGVYFYNILEILDSVLNEREFLKYFDVGFLMDIMLNEKNKYYKQIGTIKKINFKIFYLNEIYKMRLCDNYKFNRKIENFLSQNNLVNNLSLECYEKYYELIMSDLPQT